MKHALLFSLVFTTALTYSTSCSQAESQLPTSTSLQLISTKQTELVDLFWRKRLQQIRHKTLPDMMTWADTTTLLDRNKAHTYAHVLLTACHVNNFEPNKELTAQIAALTHNYTSQLATLSATEYSSIQETMFIITLKELLKQLKTLPEVTKEVEELNRYIEKSSIQNPPKGFDHLATDALLPDLETLTQLVAHTTTADSVETQLLESIWQHFTTRYLQPTGILVAPNVAHSAASALRLAQWNLQLYLNTGNAKYIDLLERLLFNGLLVHYSVSGSEFMHTTPLHLSTLSEREEWRADKLTQSELTSFIAGLTGYFYAIKGDVVTVNLFTRATTEVTENGLHFLITQRASYPWSGNAEFILDMEKPQRFALQIRLPEWIYAKQMHQSPLYNYTSGQAKIQLVVNHEQTTVKPNEFGYVVVEREWQSGDFVGLIFPTQTRRVISGEGQLGFQRGPIYFAFESFDQPSLTPITDYKFIPETLTDTHFLNGFLDNVQTISGTLQHKHLRKTEPFRTIPYYSIGTREGENRIALWIDLE